MVWTNQTKNTATWTNGNYLHGTSIATGSPIGLLLILTYATSQGAPVWTSGTKSSASWTSETKTSASWTNGTKNTASWANQTQN